MVYVALLRGINVGGNNKISMAQLKRVFEQVGMGSVSTYINSGNVIFTDDTYNVAELTQKLEAVIYIEFGFKVKVLVRDLATFKLIVETLPDSWQNDTTMKCDVMFLWERVDTADITDRLIIKPGIDDVKYVAGALLWRVDRDKVTRSGLLRIVGTDLYAHMTIRNCNTARKLLARMEAV